MNTKHLLDKILDKWPAKVICLVIAIFLYFFHQASLIDSKTVVVPLQIIENGIVMHMGNTPKSVSVVVRAEDETIKSLLTSDISASICLDSITEKGTYKLPVNITLSDSLKAYDPFEVRLKEDSVTIDVDKKAIKYIPITPSVVGEVAHGYEIESISMSPSTVEVAGPESVLNATEQIYTTRLNVSNAEINFSTETSYQQLNKLLTVLDEGPFKAEVTIKPKPMERIFDQVPVEVINLNNSLDLKEELPLVSIKLSGTMPVLENYILSKHAVQINLHEITEPGNYTVPLRYVLPANLQLVEKSDDELTITVIKKSEEKIEANAFTNSGDAGGEM
jgi:YbbR domain-containing protein